MTSTFKQLNNESNVDKFVKKVGLSLGIIFSKEDIEKFGLGYGKVVRLNNAEICEDKDI